MAMTPGLRSAVFVDKDGTLVDDVPYNVDPARLSFTPHALEALRRLAQAGFIVIVVTNQPGVALGHFDGSALQRLQAALTDRLLEAGVALSGFYACPHAPGYASLSSCLCRKPAPGLLLEAARCHGIDLGSSWMVGDILDDVEAGHRAGCRSILLDVGNETIWQFSALRTPVYRVPDLLAAAEAILADEGARLRPASLAPTRIDTANT